MFIKHLVLYSGTVLGTENTFGEYLNHNFKALQFDGKVDMQTIRK